MALEVLRGQGAHILQQRPIRRRELVPGAAVEQVQVAACDGVAFLLEELDEVGADVALVSGDEDAH